MACLDFRHLLAHALLVLLSSMLHIAHAQLDAGYLGLDVRELDISHFILPKKLFDRLADRRHAALPVVLAALSLAIVITEQHQHVPREHALGAARARVRARVLQPPSAEPPCDRPQPQRVHAAFHGGPQSFR